MKLFENGVGRPTNEIKRKRKIFIVSTVCIFCLILLCTSLYLYGSTNNKASIFSSPIVLYSDNLLGSRAEKGTNIKARARFSYIGSKMYYYDIKELSKNEKVLIGGKTCNAVPSDKKVYFSFVLNDNETRFETTVYSDSNCLNKIKSFKTRKYYLKASENKIKLTTRKKQTTTSTQTTTTQTTTKKDITMSKFKSELDMGAIGTGSVHMNNSTSFSIKSSNPKVIRVKKINSNQFEIFAIQTGEATITATASSGDKISYTYKVKEYRYIDKKKLIKGVKSEKKYRGIKVVVENGCNNNAINKYLKDINELPSYALKPTKEILFVTEKSFINFTTTERRSGVSIGFSDVIKCDKYHEIALAHEVAHNIDSYYDWFTGKGHISDKEQYAKLFNKYNGKILRTYAFTNKKEFFADSYAYYFYRYIAKTNLITKGVCKNWKYNNDVKNQIEKTIKEIEKLKW